MISIDEKTKLIVFSKKVTFKEMQEAIKPFKQIYNDIEDWEVSIQLGSLNHSFGIEKPIPPPFNFENK